MAEVAFIGLGVMGYPMAGHLARAGHAVRVFNRSPAKAERWATEHQGTIATTPAEAATGAAFVFTCVGNDDDVAAVTTGPDGALAAMAPGSVLVDHTTASADLARRLHALADARGVGFLDAPVSGGEAGAQTGRLSVMVGGDERDFARTEPVLAAYARSIALIGPPGSGQLTKMVNQLCIAGVVQGLAEGLAFAKRSGLDAERVVEAISKGAAQSWQMENRWQTMVEGRFDFGFAVDWMRKDLAMCFAEARRNGADLPLAEMVDRFYAEIQEKGGGRWDTSSLISRLVGDG
ncbi:MAG: NAD(P)-dependent oxidoreductase [Bauldia sp.]|nr:NAD(P)-dependent oxidoreductase [Bauldia sp.]